MDAMLDGAPQFQGSEFTVPLAHAGKYEVFRIRTQRKEVAK